MATGENLFSHQDARNLIRYGGMRPDRDWLQFDCALSYGLCEYQRTLAMLKDAGWSLEALHSAWRPPDVAEHRRRAWAWAATRAIRMCSSPMADFPTARGWRTAIVTMPDLPGIGFEAKSDLYPIMRDLAA